MGFRWRGDGSLLRWGSGIVSDVTLLLLREVCPYVELELLDGDAA